MLKYIILLVCLALCCQTLQAERAEAGARAQWKDAGERDPSLRSVEMAEAKEQAVREIKEARSARSISDNPEANARPAAGARSQWNGVVDDEAPNSARSVEDDTANLSWQPNSPKERHARSAATAERSEAGVRSQWNGVAGDDAEEANQARNVEEEDLVANSPQARHAKFMEKHAIKPHARSAEPNENWNKQAHEAVAAKRHEAESGKITRTQREQAARAAEAAAEAAEAAPEDTRAEAGDRSQWNNVEDDEGEHARNVAEERELERLASNPKLRHQQQMAKFAKEAESAPENSETVQEELDNPKMSKEEMKAARKKIQEQRMKHLFQQQVQMDDYKSNRQPHPAAPQEKEEEIRPFHSFFLFGLPLLGVAAIAAAAALFMHQMKQDRQAGYVVVPTDDSRSSRHAITIAPSPILKSTGKGMTPNDILASANTPDMKKMSNKQKNKLMNEGRRSPKISTPRLRSSQTFTQL